jgi:O-Antigen ligase
MLFGGGTQQNMWSDVVVQLAALPLLVSALFKLSPIHLNRSAQWGLVLLCAMLALPLIQLIPLSPAIWSAIPGRGEIASAYKAAGMDLPWLPLSLDPAATWHGLLSLIPAIAIFLAMLSLDRGARRIVVGLMLAVVLVSAPLDLLQLMGGEQSPLRFYAITNRDRGVGFFANANHQAAFLYCAIPFAAAWAIGLAHDQRKNRALGIWLLILLLAFVVIGVTGTRSRAGLALGFVAGLSSLLLVWRHERGAWGRRLLLYGVVANLVGLLIAFQFGFVGMIGRLQNSELIEDIRWPVAQVTADAALANMPFGSGFGTFVPVYQMFAPPTLLMEHYVNHAHDDWLELWLTGGVPAIMLVLCFLAWFITATFWLWRSDPPGAHALDTILARAASIIIVLLMVHSAVDYPLRTITLMAVFAIACALMIPARRIDRDVESAGPETAQQSNAGPGPTAHVIGFGRR